MALRVAFDLDGVLADLASELEKCSEDLFGGGEAQAGLGASRERRLWQHIGAVENFWERLEELEAGAVGRLAAAVDEKRWEVIFITTRPASAGATVQAQSQRWLQAKGFPLPSVYVVYGSRGKVASALDLDVVIDDRLDNCLDVIADSSARPLLFASGDAREAALPAGAQRLGIDVVQTMDECLAALMQMRTPSRDKAGIMERVMRTLGLGATPK